jgi:lambda family phage portal protein
MSFSSKLKAFFGISQPVDQAHTLPRASLEAGSLRGSLKNWVPQQTHLRSQQAFERDLAIARIDDLYGNDGVAKSGVNAIATNVIGCGLTPQSIIPAKQLGLEPEAVIEIQDQMEWLWAEWCAQAHYRDQLHFEDLQMIGLRSLIRNGEMLHLPVMDERPGCRFALRIQDIRPVRLRTPWDKQYDPYIHDGVEVSATGVPAAYWIASPPPSVAMLDDVMYTSGYFRRVPAQIGHRKGFFHIFRPESEEQYRGVSSLAAALKFFRHLNDSIDYELFAQVLAASFPVFIGLENGPQYMPSYVKEESDQEEKRYYQELHEGMIMYGNKGEKPEILESKRPSANFLNFCELVLRILASSLEIPYEVLTKDFSKTTYSSARAALLEVWRVYEVYRSFFRRHYCQPLWMMVQEEAYLRGYLKLPAGAPDFYEGMPFWCNTKWIGPARGYIDPIKEVTANIKAIDNGLMSRAEAIAERGGDVDETFEQLAREQRKREELGLKLGSAAAPSQPPAINPAENQQQSQTSADTEDNNEHTQDNNNAEKDRAEANGGE